MGADYQGASYLASSSWPYPDALSCPPGGPGWSMERARELAASTARQRPAKVYSSYSFHR